MRTDVFITDVSSSTGRHNPGVTTSSASLFYIPLMSSVGDHVINSIVTDWSSMLPADEYRVRQCVFACLHFSPVFTCMKLTANDVRKVMAAASTTSVRMRRINLSRNFRKLSAPWGSRRRHAVTCDHSSQSYKPSIDAGEYKLNVTNMAI